LDTLTDRLNEFLKKQGLGLLRDKPANVEILYESALRSVWKLENKEKREKLASEITVFLKKYVGGKNIEELYPKITQKLDMELERQNKEAAKQAGEERLKDPNYVPSFDELFPDEKKSQ
jgi:hypothetical protein